MCGSFGHGLRRTPTIPLGNASMTSGRASWRARRTSSRSGAECASATSTSRRARWLTEANAAFYFDPVADKGKRVYRDLTPRAAKVFAGWLAEALGGAGLHLGQLELADIEKRKQDRLELRAALAELK